jgi:(p)ppGpp synthase/HD superfamily hydrolase
VVAAQGFGIDALQTTTDRAEGTARTTISLQVPDLARLAGVLRALARVPNVIAANRS